ncbi:MAG: YitT family protein [Oscillospiraceae bacterium]|nr:YitT family protein [Oscillospiraceae bacterium]
MKLKLSSCIAALLASAFLAFGLYHVHSFSGVTEGGVLGLTLLLEHWLHISPALSGFVLNALCYALGWRLLGREFIAYSAIASVGFSVAYKVCEQFPPLWPQLAELPLLAAIVGAVFVGVGAGVCVRAGGATGGDDALAMSAAHVTGWNIEWVYLLSDFVVLALSVSYIPLERIGYSILTVLLSGQIIGLIQKLPFDKLVYKQ